jgi:biopolymer transport protein ExbD
MRIRRLHKKPAELEIIAFINLIVVLVPFLLSVAVFSRLAVLDIELPAPAAAALAQVPAGQLQLEVVIRAQAFEVGDRVGGLIQRIERLPATATAAAAPSAEPDRPALGELAALLLQIKARYPEQKEATVLAETDTPYDTLVQVMDTLRAGAPAADGSGTQAELFPLLSVGDAPVRATAALAPPGRAGKAGGA